MSRQYGYTVKIEAWVAVKPDSDDAHTKAIDGRKDAILALEDAGFTVTAKSLFGHRNKEPAP